MATKKTDQPAGPIDRVQMVSRKADGTPDQTDEFEIIGDRATAVAAAAEQLGQQRVSNEDQARARAEADEAAAAGESSLSPEEEERIAKHRSLMESAAADAAAEVDAHHAGADVGVAPLERSVPVETATTRSSGTTGAKRTT